MLKSEIVSREANGVNSGAELREALLRDATFVPFAQVLEAYRGGENPDVSPHVEANIIAALLLEDAWRFVEETRNRLEFSYGLSSMDAGIGTGKPLDINVLEMRFSRCESHTDILDTVLKGMTATASFSIVNWLNSSDTRGSAHTTNILRVRYKDLLEIERDAFLPKNELDRLSGGVTSGLLATTALWGLIPELYRKQFGRSITASETENLCESTRAIIFAITQLDVKTFVVLREALRGELKDEVRHENGRRALPISILRIVDKGGTLGVSFSEPALAMIRELLGIDAWRIGTDDPSEITGCPARLAKNSSGQSIITDLFDWNMQVARKLYFPFVESVERNRR